MANVFEVAQTLIQHIQTRFKGDIALVAYYGSYAQGTATSRSDLDFFFIPSTPQGFRAALSFLCGGISFDFWPIRWERAERMAAFEEPNTSIIADCKLLYVRSDADLARFEQLRKRISETGKPSLALIEKAENHLRDAYVHMYQMSLLHNDSTGNLTLFRTEAHGVLTHALYALALLNGTYFTKGWGKNTEQINQFHLKPARLDEHMHTFMQTSETKEIQTASEQLVQDMLELLNAQKAHYAAGPDYKGRMKGFYEEIRGQFDKLLTACEANDYTTAFFWSIGAQDEIARFLYYSRNGYWPSAVLATADYMHEYIAVGLPDLPKLLASDRLSELRDMILLLDERLRSLLQSHTVHIAEFETPQQLELYLDQRG
ncbi:nucleotidyltransferase domain-containing protein [Paenibacillus sp. 2TAB19]|uniref:nucleotidyltransferase domain-containing protein n=1 Tax=Paenibacillus sp. 2TAB19 TaxID=3233003 RepID=UPI003F9D56B4